MDPFLTFSICELQRVYLYQNGVEFLQKVIGDGINLFWGHLQYFNHVDSTLLFRADFSAPTRADRAEIAFRAENMKENKISRWFQREISAIALKSARRRHFLLFHESFSAKLYTCTSKSVVFSHFFVRFLKIFTLILALRTEKIRWKRWELAKYAETAPVRWGVDMSADPTWPSNFQLFYEKE